MVVTRQILCDVLRLSVPTVDFVCSCFNIPPLCVIIRYFMSSLHDSDLLRLGWVGLSKLHGPTFVYNAAPVTLYVILDETMISIHIIIIISPIIIILLTYSLPVQSGT